MLEVYHLYLIWLQGQGEADQKNLDAFESCLLDHSNYQDYWAGQAQVVEEGSYVVPPPSGALGDAKDIGPFIDSLITSGKVPKAPAYGVPVYEVLVDPSKTSCSLGGGTGGRNATGTVQGAQAGLVIVTTNPASFWPARTSARWGRALNAARGGRGHRRPPRRRRVLRRLLLRGVVRQSGRAVVRQPAGPQVRGRADVDVHRVVGVRLRERLADPDAVAPGGDDLQLPHHVRLQGEDRVLHRRRRAPRAVQADERLLRGPDVSEVELLGQGAVRDVLLQGRRRHVHAGHRLLRRPELHRRQVHVRRRGAVVRQRRRLLRGARVRHDGEQVRHRASGIDGCWRRRRGGRPSRRRERRERLGRLGRRLSPGTGCRRRRRGRQRRCSRDRAPVAGCGCVVAGGASPAPRLLFAALAGALFRRRGSGSASRRDRRG